MGMPRLQSWGIMAAHDDSWRLTVSPPLGTNYLLSP